MSHVFCQVQCAMYPRCTCFKEAEKAANTAMSKLPADTLAQWETDIDRESGTITFTARNTRGTNEEES